MPDIEENVQSQVNVIKDSRIMDIIIKSLLGTHATTSMYKLSHFESDVLYLPQTETDKELPAILVKVQNTIDPISMSKAIQSCTSLYAEHQVLPILLLISTKGYSSETFKAKFETNDDNFLAEAYCEFWAKHCYVMSPESICKFLNKDPLNELLALGYFFIDSKACLKRDDPTVKLISGIIKEKVYNCTE